MTIKNGDIPADVKKLREINHALADDIELRDKEIAALKAKVYMVDQGEGGARITWQDAFESAGPKLSDIKKLKAEAIREMIAEVVPCCMVEIEDYADKLEANND